LGNAAELCAEKFAISRKEQDDFAVLSYKRALNSSKTGLFNDEIIAVEIPQKKGKAKIVDKDEEPGKVNFEKLPLLNPVFKKDGTVTAANASSINDGAAGVLVMSSEKANEFGIKPIAQIIAQVSTAKNPEEFTTAPADSIKKCLDKANLKINDIDLFEINEAFSVVALVNNKILGIPVEKVNVKGGSVALGHPIGASGARILVTLIHTMRQQKVKRGLASICIGGGEASTLILENPAV
jgi:acetyl-CoA C-acetyltransferase